MAEHEQDIPVEHDNEHFDEDAVDTPMERFFYHQRRALEETGHALEALLPPKFRDHAEEASKEFAKGFRVLIDSAIDELKKVSEREDEDEDIIEDIEEENDDDDEPPSTTGKTKVRVKLD